MVKKNTQIVTKLKLGNTDVIKMYKGNTEAYQNKLASFKAAGGILYLDSLKATGDGLPSNSPLTYPWIDLSGNSYSRTFINKLGDSGNFSLDTNSDGLADSMVITGSLSSKAVTNNVQKFTASAANSGIYFNPSGMITNHLYYAYAVVKSTSANVKLILRADSTGDIATFTTGSGNFEVISCRAIYTKTSGSFIMISDTRVSGYTETEVKLLHLVDLSVMFEDGLEPSKTQMDYIITKKISESGYINNASININNHAYPINFAGSIASGVDTNPLKPNWVLDGVDDFFNIINTPNLDILNAPLAIFLTVNINEFKNAYLYVKHLNSSNNAQYGIFTNSSGVVGVYLNGVSMGLGPTLNLNTWYNIGFIWDGITVKYYLNGFNVGTNGSYSGSLNSQPNIRIGKREGGAYHKGAIATVTKYAGLNAITSKILSTEQMIALLLVIGGMK